MEAACSFKLCGATSRKTALFFSIKTLTWRMRWEKRVARMGDRINTCNILVCKVEANSQVGRLWLGLVDVKEIG